MTKQFGAPLTSVPLKHFSKYLLSCFVSCFFMRVNNFFPNSDLIAQTLVNATHAGPTVTLRVLLQGSVQLSAFCGDLGGERSVAQHRCQVALGPLLFLLRFHADRRRRFRCGVPGVNRRPAGRPRERGAAFVHSRMRRRVGTDTVTVP